MAKRKNKGRRPKWTPFEECDAKHWEHQYVARLGERAYDIPELIPDRVFFNSRYVVFWYDVPEIPSEETPDGKMWPPMIHLSIKNHARTAHHDWRDLQRIKNEIIGPEHEAVELFPAESRLVDAANQFHLYVLAVNGMQFPFGMTERIVMDSDGEPDAHGAKQRPFEVKPPDALSKNDLAEKDAQARTESEQRRFARMGTTDRFVPRRKTQ